MTITEQPDPVKKNPARRVNFSLHPDDARALIRNLTSRAEWFRNRREPDPMIKSMAATEADRLDGIARMIAEGVAA
ncbi:hypothetical protein [Acidiphilium acidophilum]|uniref:hypothetical protein n=1 Tax=Acidiphilium acidophilum TaxID=76588 RepID=UPI002E8E6B81|nr:hypothetical protein [Acidiphilium acidophilum]